MLCNSILECGGVMSADKTIKFSPAKSILKLQIGDKIKLTESDFVLRLRRSLPKWKPNFVPPDHCSGNSSPCSSPSHNSGRYSIIPEASP